MCVKYSSKYKQINCLFNCLKSKYFWIYDFIRLKILLSYKWWYKELQHSTINRQHDVMKAIQMYSGVEKPLSKTHFSDLSHHLMQAHLFIRINFVFNDLIEIIWRPFSIIFLKMTDFFENFGKTCEHMTPKNGLTNELSSRWCLLHIFLTFFRQVFINFWIECYYHCCNKPNKFSSIKWKMSLKILLSSTVYN